MKTRKTISKRTSKMSVMGVGKKVMSKKTVKSNILGKKSSVPSKKIIWGETTMKKKRKGKTYYEGTVFVAMPFKKNKTYKVIEKVCKKQKLIPKRVKDIDGSHNIIETIKYMIGSAEFLIFDISENNPNVLYELGFAHALGNSYDDLIIVRKKDRSKRPFDISSINIKEYKDLNELEKYLSVVLKKLKRKPASKK